MAKTRSKGTVLKLDIASTMTAVGQLLEVTPPKIRTTDFDSTTLDTVLGTEKDLTGYAESDPFEATLWWDPELAVQAAILAAITTPAKTDWQIVYVNAGASVMDFTCAGLEQGVTVAMQDGLKSSIKGNIDGIVALTV